MGCDGAAARLGWAAGDGKVPSGCTGRAFPFLLNSVKLKFTAEEKEKSRVVGDDFGRYKSILILLELCSI